MRTCKSQKRNFRSSSSGRSAQANCIYSILPRRGFDNALTSWACCRILVPRMSRHIEKSPTDAALLQGTLDMLILKVVALGPIHGYAIAQRLQQMSKNALQIRQ